MTILVVDDDDDIRESVREILQGEGLDTIGAANGEEARTLLYNATELPSLILLDLMMPVMDGWDFLLWIEDEPEMRDIPVAIMSAHPSIQRAAAVSRPTAPWPRLLLHGGVRPLLPKPVSFLRLLDVAKNPGAHIRV